MKTAITILCLFSSQAVFSQSTENRADRQLVYQDLFKRDAIPKYGSDQIQNALSASTKNVGLAVLYSLLLPGMGELYVGEYGVGKFFTIGEAALWLAYTSFELYGNWLRDDARRFAASHAGVQLSGRDDQFFVDIGNFLNTYDYNEAKLRNREPEKLYDVNSGLFWQWDSDANRASYRDLRISHDRVFNNAQFVAAAIIVNHIASAVNAARLAISHNAAADETGMLEIRARVIGGISRPDGIMISLSKNF